MRVSVIGQKHEGEGSEHMLPKTRYGAFLEEIKRRWVHEGRKEIRETDEFISTFNVKKGAIGKIMELCPGSKALSIFGQGSNGEDAYPFSLRCFDTKAHEPDPSTKVNCKLEIGSGVAPLWKASYGSLRRYYFKNSIFLENGERLELVIINPDIDIDKVEVSMELDVFSPI